MSLAELRTITRAHVLEALAEHDKIGAEKFLTKYGRGKSRRYLLLHEDKRYDSKAIAGAAYGYANPGKGPLLEFSGGHASVQRVLGKELGFAFEVTPGAAEPGEEEHGNEANEAIPPVWREALDRVAAVQRHPLYMPAALLVALDVLDENPGERLPVRFEVFRPRFDALLAEAEPTGRRDAAMPFFHLSQQAAIWRLLVDGRQFTGSGSSVPPGCEARFVEALAETVGQEDARAAVRREIYRRAPGALTAAHRYLKSRSSSAGAGARFWELCVELFEIYPKREGHASKDAPAYRVRDELEKEAGELAETLIPSPTWKGASSVGLGRWADTPWIAFYDVRVTSSARHGVYPVVHFVFGAGAPVLRLGIGVSYEEHGSRSAEQARKVREQLDPWSQRTFTARDFTLEPPRIEGQGTLARGYADGMVIQKLHSLDDLRENAEVLTDDVRALLASYLTWVDMRENTLEHENTVPIVRDLRVACDELERAASRRGLQYERTLLECLLLSLKTKPFCLLAGPTGTGKSRLARLLEDVGAEVHVEPVEPSWTDGTSVIGYRDLNGKYQSGILTRHAEKAAAAPDRVHVLVLDELNLARVEHYLAQWLSVIESRRLSEGTVEADFLVDDGDKRVHLPENLVVVGTVNMDESTFAFSQRVLDRANVLALPSPRALSGGGAPKAPVAIRGGILSPDALRPLAISWLDIEEAAEESHRAAIMEVVNAYLQPTQDALAANGARARLSFRLRDEICAYILHGLASDLTDKPARLVDQQLRQRLLPKLCDGSALLSPRLVDALAKVWQQADSGPAGAAGLLREVWDRQKSEDMPVSLWTVLA